MAYYLERDVRWFLHWGDTTRYVTRVPSSSVKGIRSLYRPSSTNATPVYPIQCRNQSQGRWTRPSVNSNCRYFTQKHAKLSTRFLATDNQSDFSYDAVRSGILRYVAGYVFQWIYHHQYHNWGFSRCFCVQLGVDKFEVSHMHNWFEI